MSARDQLKTHFVETAQNRAVSHARWGRWDAAEDELDAWEALTPASPEIPLMRARIRFHQGRRQDAMSELERAAQAGADRALVDRMQAFLTNDDARMVRDRAQRIADREARKQFAHDMLAGLGEFLSGLSPREAAYLAAGIAFVAFVLLSSPTS
jgi:Flp pilus assembly protein TadD